MQSHIGLCLTHAESLMGRQDCLQLMLAGYKLWPMVSFLSFTVVPVQSRVVFGSVIGVGWGIFLSLFTAH